MKKKILFIINPISGVGRQKVVEKLIDKRLNLNQFTPEITYTKAPKHAIELSKEAANNYDVVVAVGGDGSVNEISQGLINSDTALAIIPTGSGNGLAKHLHIPKKLEDAIKTINKFKTKKIDSVEINDLKFVNVAGIGFDAYIAHLFNKLGKRGFQSYAQIVQKRLPDYLKKNKIKTVVTIDGKSYERETFVISFANSSQYGNDAYIAPNAKIDDGLLDICFIKNFPTGITPVLAIRLFTQTLDRSKYMDVIQGKEINIKFPEIHGNKLIEAHIDGEPVYFKGEINMKVIPKSLNVIVP